jgi:hypothetical protein
LCSTPLHDACPSAHTQPTTKTVVGTPLHNHGKPLVAYTHTQHKTHTQMTEPENAYDTDLLTRDEILLIFGEEGLSVKQQRKPVGRKLSPMEKLFHSLNDGQKETLIEQLKQYMKIR